MRQTLHPRRTRLIGLFASGALVIGAAAASPVQAASDSANTNGGTTNGKAGGGRNATANDNLRPGSIPTAPLTRARVTSPIG